MKHYASRRSCQQFIKVNRINVPLDNRRGGNQTLVFGARCPIALSSPCWGIRLTWNRVATNYNSDTDVLLGGLTYRF